MLWSSSKSVTCSSERWRDLGSRSGAFSNPWIIVAASVPVIVCIADLGGRNPPTIPAANQITSVENETTLLHRAGCGRKTPWEALQCEMMRQYKKDSALISCLENGFGRLK